MRRGSKTKEEDPDYWETSKPIKKDGMTAQSRNDPVKKNVVYLDFRAEADRDLQFSMDADYVDKITFLNDYKVFFGIIKTVISGKNVYKEEVGRK